MSDRPPECPDCSREMTLQSVKEDEKVWHCEACKYWLVDRTVGSTRPVRSARDAEPMFASVQGHCPNGCGATLELNIVTGQMSCSHGECPDPNAVQLILDHNEPHHIIRIGPDGWVVKHPLLERVEDKLFDCQITKAMSLFTGPPVGTRHGDYAVTVNDDGSWNWTRLEDL